ncbi:hypothetical protein B0H13DRAFT_2371034 [Mycena leptocephala]|nr:hypothetical protein B0H13DRAFT_2371034 [Mycena leptocephala]
MSVLQFWSTQIPEVCSKLPMLLIALSLTSNSCTATYLERSYPLYHPVPPVPDPELDVAIVPTAPRTVGQIPKSEPLFHDLTRRATSAELKSLINGDDDSDDANTSQNTFIYDDLVPLNVHLMKLSYYQMVDGLCKISGTDNFQIAFEIFDQFITGSRFQVLTFL